MNSLKNIDIHRIYEENVKGTDYFISDLHGCYDLFLEMMSKVKLNEDIDRVFSVGDLIDRGQYSQECLKLAANDWFIPVLGNHEELLLTSFNNGFVKDLWERNGGGWWDNLCENERFKSLNIIMKNFSITATVKTINGNIGLVHADYLCDTWPVNASKLSRELLRELLWSRKTLSEMIVNKVNGVNLIISGHTPIRIPKLIGNHLFLDTGCGHFPNETITHPKLTVAEIIHGGIKLHMLDKKNYQILDLPFKDI